MKIVVLDGYTLNPGDLDWESFKKMGDFVSHDRTPYDNEKIVKRIGNAEIILTNKTPINAEIIQKCPHLKYIGVLATGYNVVDIEEASIRGITVTNVPDYSSNTVAQFTMALLLEMCHHIGDHNNNVHNGEWIESKDFSFWNYPLIELAGKTMGIIGFGKIGKATTKLAQAFGLNILVYNRTVYKDFENEHLKFVSLTELFENSDIISLHCPLTPETENIINQDNIKKMKNGVMLINTSRGHLIDEKDLAKALKLKKISQAALDVISKEPMKKDSPLLNVKNCIITPHIAWASKEARMRLMKTASDNLESFLKGSPINVVN